MKDVFKDLTVALDKPLAWQSRLVVFLAAIVLIPALFLPLWHMTFESQQYPEGLNLYIYTNDLVGGDLGNDLVEINVLNHYIGMAELKKEDFVEFKWIPMAIIIFVLLSLRTVIVGKYSTVFDEFLLLISFGAFSLWSFFHRLYLYGHNLDPKASVQVEPFTPPVYGHKMVGQFDVWSYPSAGAWCFVAFILLLLSSFIFIRSWRKSDKQSAKVM